MVYGMPKVLNHHTILPLALLILNWWAWIMYLMFLLLLLIKIMIVVVILAWLDKI
jgi:hypothetical protein